MTSYLGMETHSDTMLVALVVVLLMVKADRVGYLIFTAVAWGVFSRAGDIFGFDSSDVFVAFAAIVAVQVIPMLLKRLLTIAATYPLALTFKYACQVLPKYTIDESNFFSCDGCSSEVAAQRKKAIMELSEKWQKKYTKCIDFSTELKTMISDLRFTSGRCFPAFNDVVGSYLDPSIALEETKGMDVIDMDGNSSMDISGSYGVNVCGYEKYKEFIDEGWASAKKKGLFLGSLDNTVLDNISRLRKVSGHDEVSFHMSGTEAVMAAVRCARWNTGKQMVVTFGGAYHGWWDGMQPVVGNERDVPDVLCLKDMKDLSLMVIKLRKSEIGAVVVNPLQCFHLNQSPPSDPVLATNMRKVGPTAGYKEWLHKLKKVCQECSIVLIFDEVYTGFRLHPRGAQGAYDVQADIVTYGKTLGGGLPIGVVCGPKSLMARGDPKKAARVNYVIGTFAGHPFVMATMNAFLKWGEKPETVKSYDVMHDNVDSFIQKTNAAMKEKGFPVEFANWFSVWSVMYTQPGRFHWMLQYYMKDAGINLSWVGTGRLLFSLDWQKADYDRLLDRILIACAEMKKGGWWEAPKTNIKVSLAKEMSTAVFKNLTS